MAFKALVQTLWAGVKSPIIPNVTSQPVLAYFEGSNYAPEKFRGIAGPIQESMSQKNSGAQFAF